MKLEYRVLEMVKGEERSCDYCFIIIDLDDITDFSFDTAPATVIRRI